MFLNDTPNSLVTIKTALSNSDWADLYKNAHKIKPSIEMLGLPSELVDALLKINEYSKTESNLEELPQLISFFSEKMESVFEELKTVLTELQ